MTGLRRFNFDTVFDDAGSVVSQAPRPKRHFTAEEVEAARQQGFQEGERSAMVRAAEAQAQALAQIAAMTHQALGALTGVAHGHRTGAAELALACGRAIADSALNRYPIAPVQAALQVLAAEVEAAPRLIIRTASQDPEIVQKLEDLARDNGYPGQIQVRVEPGPAAAAFTLDWSDGKAAYDPDAAGRRVAEAIAEALQADALHAQPLIPDGAF